ncbi:hypothetical protein [Streptomyces sp. NPDC048603]|uniref:hypothetical protein n=1 Tax=Streptomyces sp. NPDC048603 TaxID=3365577 RepID=UPI0037158CC1
MTTPAVTGEMIRRAQAGDSAAMWDVISACEQVLRGIVKSVAPEANADESEDLLQEARAVLIGHVHNYDVDASATLGTFAFAAVRRGVWETWLSMTTKHSVDASTVYVVRRALYDAKGNVELAWLSISAPRQGRRQMSRERFMSAIAALQNVESLESAVPGSDGDVTLGDVIPDPVDVEGEADRRNTVRWLLTKIAPRQAFVLRATFGIGMTAMEDAEIGDTIGGITPAAVRKLRSNGFEGCRRVAADYELRIARREAAVDALVA